MNVKRSFFILLFFGLIAIVLFSVIKPKTKQEQTAQLIIPNNVDYYLSHTKQKRFNQDGVIDFTLNAALLKHFKREDKSQLTAPDVHIQRDNNWQIQAQQGEFFHPEEIISFNTNVRLDKHSETAPFQVSANKLLLNIKQDLVISESNVKVIANSWQLEAKTMTLNLKNEIHQFSHVTARY